jgi:hypothetical protein
MNERKRSLLLLAALAALIVIMGPATAMADGIQIDDLAFANFMGHELITPVPTLTPVIATLTFTITDDNEDGIIRIGGEDYELPLKVIVSCHSRL